MCLCSKFWLLFPINQSHHVCATSSKWLHIIWPYSSRTWESIRYANWGRGICATSSFTKFLILELVALNLALQFAYLGKCQVCELGKRNMCNQFVHKNFCLENWLHLIWPYSSRSCESIMYGNWCLLICETSSFIMTFLSSELVPTYLGLIFNFLALGGTWCHSGGPTPWRLRWR